MLEVSKNIQKVKFFEENILRKYFLTNMLYGILIIVFSNKNNNNFMDFFEVFLNQIH